MEIWQILLFVLILADLVCAAAALIWGIVRAVRGQPARGPFRLVVLFFVVFALLFFVMSAVSSIISALE